MTELQETPLKRGNWADNPCFFVSVVDAGRTALVLGPFNTEAECRRWAYREFEDGGSCNAGILRNAALARDAKSWFYSWGMVKVSHATHDGILNSVIEAEGHKPVYYDRASKGQLSFQKRRR